MGFLRILLLLFGVLLAVYLILSVLMRLRERRRLGGEWEEGLAAYDRSLRRKLLWLVVVLPMAGLMILLYVLNIS